MMVRLPWAVLGVPIDSVGRSGGTEFAPAALRAAGLVARLGARDAGDLAVRVRGDVRDPATGLVGSADVLALTPVVRAAVRSVISAGERPFLLGGCCTLLPGALAGARDALGAIGLASVDGHVDIYDGTTSPTGEAADMPVGVALGRGPSAWADAAGGPSLTPGAVVVLGARDPDEADDIAELLAGPLAELSVLGPGDLRESGPGTAAASAAARLADAPGRFWVHLDVDVLGAEVMPATDYLMPGGLDWDELAALLAPLGASAALAGVSIGCVNPERDPGGGYVARIAGLLAGAFA